MREKNWREELAGRMGACVTWRRVGGGKTCGCDVCHLWIQCWNWVAAPAASSGSCNRVPSESHSQPLGTDPCPSRPAACSPSAPMQLPSCERERENGTLMAEYQQPRRRSHSAGTRSDSPTVISRAISTSIRRRARGGASPPPQPPHRHPCGRPSETRAQPRLDKRPHL